MSLPNELKLQILSYIEIDMHNTYHTLRQVHPWFRARISKMELRDRVLAAEQNPRKVPRSHLVCYTCFKVLPHDAFQKHSIVWPPYLRALERWKKTCFDCRLHV